LAFHGHLLADVVQHLAATPVHWIYDRRQLAGGDIASECGAWNCNAEVSGLIF
jgi:hypothetical protein